MCLNTRRMLLFIKENKKDSLKLLDMDVTLTKTLLNHKPMETIHFLRAHSGRAIKILKPQFTWCQSSQDATQILKSVGRAKARWIIANERIWAVVRPYIQRLWWKNIHLPASCISTCHRPPEGSYNHSSERIRFQNDRSHERISRGQFRADFEERAMLQAFSAQTSYHGHGIGKRVHAGRCLADQVVPVCEKSFRQLVSDRLWRRCCTIPCIPWTSCAICATRN